MFNFFRTTPTGDITKCGNPKTGKIWGILPPTGNRLNRINRSRQNLACECRLWLYSSTPNLALIGRGAGYSSPQIWKIA